MKKTLKILLAIGVLVGVWFLLEPRLSTPGDLLKSKPKQSLRPGIPFVIDKFTIYPIASFEVDGRVLAFRQYEHGSFDQMCPFDVGIGWGFLSSEEVASRYGFNHRSRRLYITRVEDRETFDRLKVCLANIHVIPANEEVKATLSTLKKDDLIAMKGKLVTITDDQGRFWLTSLRRSDTGDGACEILYATSVEILSGDGEAPAAMPQQPTVVRYDPADIELQPFRYPAEVALISELEIPVDDGAIIVPAGDYIEILRKQGSYTRARYRSHNFWIKSDQLDGSI